LEFLNLSHNLDILWKIPLSIARMISLSTIDVSHNMEGRACPDRESIPECFTSMVHPQQRSLLW
jgi:hypothetical protein